MTVIIFLVILAILIFVHELGHFLMAKRAGIRVDEFGLGFPPRLVSWQKGETTYSLNLIPFGGFVKIFGENPDEESIEGPEKERSMVHKSKWIQAMVLAAGVAFNLIFAWVLISIGFIAGMPTPAEQIGRFDRSTPARLIITAVIPGSPADQAGLKTGDEIVGLTGPEAVLAGEISVDDVREFIATHPETEIAFEYRRGKIFDEEVDLPAQVVSVIPASGLATDEDGTERAAIGIAMDNIAMVRKPAPIAVWDGLKLTARLVYLIVFALGRLIADALTGEAVLNNITGPVGMVGLVGDASSLGLIYLLSFTAFISINLAVINLVPFPALDGGRLLFLLIEKIKGSPIKPVIANTLNIIGFALLLIFMLAVTYGDITRLFR